MIFSTNIHQQSPLREIITKNTRIDETLAVSELLKEAHFSSEAQQRIYNRATEILANTRKARHKQWGLDSFLHKYDLSSEEGIVLMCLAEALLRIPDTYTLDLLISDKIGSADWRKHLDFKNSLFTNALTSSLMLVGKIYHPYGQLAVKNPGLWQHLLKKFIVPLIRPIILQGMQIVGKQFVMATTIEEALKRAKHLEKKGYTYSYDMLGEGARTQEDAEKYFNAYKKSIITVGEAHTHPNLFENAGVSIKLSALHPRYEVSQRTRVMQELMPKVLELAKYAKAQNISMVIDAEEADRLELSLDIFEAVFTHDSLKNWEGLGLAVQAYQKRAPFVIDWLYDLAKSNQRKITLRLIKGAYWDYEIKLSQMMGLPGYPVFTRKNATDVSYLACAKRIASYKAYFYPQFGTHNAYSVAAILEIMGEAKGFEFQCLHGMGETLYDQMVAAGYPCRIYAPVGSHKDLLGYLVRRLLENGANTSFINLIAKDSMLPETILRNPVDRMASLAEKPHPHIPLPRYIYHERLNAIGLDLTNMNTLRELKEHMDLFDKKTYESGPLINGRLIKRKEEGIQSPSDIHRQVGIVYDTAEEDIAEALDVTQKALSNWSKTPVTERAACLNRAADLFEKNMHKFMFLLCREGGKPIVDCLSEVRETIDYCRYYAERAKIDCAPKELVGPTGESNILNLHPRGIIACISPWNFPLAIFSGQILAALVTGNGVIAKPAEQTPLVAAEAVRLMHEAGIPKEVLQLLPGDGAKIGSKLLEDSRIRGVMFTGSTETAKKIQELLTCRPGPIVPFIAETGGQNAMIVDSSALPEQVVADIMTSSFNSAGQRCSALRILFLQEDIAENLITMLKNAMAELRIGDPGLLSTDVGPVIDQEALTMLEEHVKKMKQEAKLIFQVPLPPLKAGYYFAPAAFKLENINILHREVFGPILHIIPYKADHLDEVIDAIIKTGYGLTLGIHSRIDATVKYIIERVPVGNIYVNRNMIGAVVGVQPFGGEGLSGTGPKAGGPHYLPRLCVERTVTINTTASGGNANLLSLNEDGN